MEGPLDALLSEVKALADEATPELLPRLMRVMMDPRREGLVTCARHSIKLFPYVRAQIILTRAKRNYWHYDGWTGAYVTEDKALEARQRAERERDSIRKEYRSTPCTCWVTHR